MGSPFQVGLVGKVTAQADFLKIQAQAPAAQALHRWLEDSYEALVRGAHKLPSGALGFVFAASESLLVGTLMLTRDKVGRTFPTAVFALGPRQTDLPAVVEAFSPFLRAGATLLEGNETLDVPELSRRVAALPAPQSSDIVRAKEDAKRRLATSHQGKLQALFEKQGAPGCHYYGVRTFITACDAERRGDPGRQGLALDCPCALEPELAPSFWTELLVRRVPRWSSANFLWTDNRLLLGFGAPHASWLSFIAKPDHPSMKRWPLVTNQISAVDTARNALPAALKLALDRNDTSWDALLTAAAA